MRLRYCFTCLLLSALCAVSMSFAQSGQVRVVENGGTGAYPAQMMEIASLPAHTVFAPQDLSPFGGDNLLPVVVWGNGACANSPWEHYRFLNEIASHGFLVLATGFMPSGDEPYRGKMSTAQQQIESIDWAFAQNADPQSPYYQKIDTKHICVAGMSCGGLQSLFNCADSRISAMIHTPVMYLLGGPTDIAYENGMDDFRRITHVPACVANYPVGHGGTYGEQHGGEFAVAALAWLQWQLKGDKRASKMFRGKGCLLSKRKDWTIEKNVLFDSLR